KPSDGTDGFRVLCHQFFISSLPRLACLSGFKNVCQRAQAFASQLLPLQRLCHLQSKDQMIFLQATDFRTDLLSSQYRVTSVHLTETCDDDSPHLITHVETTPAPVADDATVPLIHEALAERDLLPGVHIVDTGYVDAE